MICALGLAPCADCFDQTDHVLWSVIRMQADPHPFFALRNGGMHYGSCQISLGPQKVGQAVWMRSNQGGNPRRLRDVGRR
jgi:hypothetical protein